MPNKYRWLWKSCPSSLVSNISEEWREYSDVEISVIEDAYQQKRDQVELDSGIIYFRHCLQIDKLDPTKARRLQRIFYEDILGEKRSALLRQNGWQIRTISFDGKDRCKR